MQQALSLARQAAAENEVPVGALLVRDGQVLGQGYNQTITDSDPTAHAEIVAIRRAAEKRGNYRLPGTTLYVTLEPCTMCVGCIIHARIERVVYAASDPKTGAAGSQFDLLEHPAHNHKLQVESGLMAAESALLLRQFFQQRR